MLLFLTQRIAKFKYSGIYGKSSRYGVDSFVLIGVRGFGEPVEYDKRSSKMIHAFLWTKTKYILGTALDKYLSNRDETLHGLLLR